MNFRWKRLIGLDSKKIKKSEIDEIIRGINDRLEEDLEFKVRTECFGGKFLMAPNFQIQGIDCPVVSDLSAPLVDGCDKVFIDIDVICPTNSFTLSIIHDKCLEGGVGELIDNTFEMKIEKLFLNDGNDIYVHSTKTIQYNGILSFKINAPFDQKRSRKKRRLHLIDVTATCLEHMIKSLNEIIKVGKDGDLGEGDTGERFR